MLILLQFYADSFKTLQVLRSWSEDLHIVWIYIFCNLLQIIFCHIKFDKGCLYYLDVMPSDKLITVKPAFSSHSKEDQKLVFKTDYHLMQVKSITECSTLEHNAKILTCIKR